MTKQKFSEIGIKHKDLLFKKLEEKYHYYKFVNLTYNNCENHIEMLVFSRHFGDFLGIFHIDVTDYCLFKCVCEDAQLVKRVLDTCEDLKYNSID